MPCPARDALANNIKRLRADLGWSQEELAFRAGLHRTFVAHVERRARNISIDNIQRLADALGVAPARLLTSPTGTLEPVDDRQIGDSAGSA